MGARANMRSFVALCLVAAAAGSPAKLGQAHRQGRQGGYIAPVEEQAAYGNTAAASTIVDTRVAAEPIGIRSQSFDGPLPEFKYSFETENDISQSAEGSLKEVDGVNVVVMVIPGLLTGMLTRLDTILLPLIYQYQWSLFSQRSKPLLRLSSGLLLRKMLPLLLLPDPSHMLLLLLDMALIRVVKKVQS